MTLGERNRPANQSMPKWKEDFVFAKLTLNLSHLGSRTRLTGVSESAFDGGFFNWNLCGV